VYWSAAFTFKLSSPLDSIEKRFKLSKKFYKANSPPPPPFLAKLTISKLTTGTQEHEYQNMRTLAQNISLSCTTRAPLYKT